MECRDKGQISIPEKVDIETQVLDLSGNNLQILPREVFSRRGLLNLQKLYLSNCKIGQIDPTAFRGLTNLVELNLSGNLLTSVPTATFSGKPIYHHDAPEITSWNLGTFGSFFLFLVLEGSSGI